MTTISIRLTEEDERNLKAIRKATGRTASEAIRRAIKTERVAVEKVIKPKTAAEIYAEIMAASEGESVGTPTDDASHVSERVRAILEAKHKRESQGR